MGYPWGGLVAVANDGIATGFSDAIRGALVLDVETFRQVQAFAPEHHLGLWVALLAGLSRGVAEGFILFVNRVRPLRFALSLLMEAILFAISFLLWAGSTWLVARFWFNTSVPIDVVIRALGLAYAPQLFSFLGALPYLGVPWLTLLSVWTAIAFVRGMRAVSGLEAWDAFWCLVTGWLAIQLIQRTAGQPVMNFGRWLRDRGAGVAVVADRFRLEEMVQAGRPDQSGDRRK